MNRHDIHATRPGSDQNEPSISDPYLPTLARPMDTNDTVYLPALTTCSIRSRLPCLAS